MKKYFFIFIVAFFASCSPVEQDVIHHRYGNGAK